MEILWAEPIGFVKGSGFISLYISTQVIIQTFLNPKIYNSGIGLHVCGNIRRVDSPHWSGSWYYIFPYCPAYKALWVCIGEKYWLKYQYYPVQ